MKQAWEFKSFEDCLIKVKYTTKVQSIDYLEEGLYPIISQEEELISGYWNVDSDVFKITTPVVIFGDHTRVLKYVDFDFVLGADGVKILHPVSGVNAKFLLYFLMATRIPSLGYSRHYKLLKDLSVPIPSISEQEHIVAELDLLSSVIEKKRQQLKELDNLAQSIFYDMFGDPITNEKGWEVLAIDNVCSSIVRGPFGSALKKDFFVEPLNDTYKVYEQKHAIQKNATIGTYYISSDMFKTLSRFEVKNGDIIMSCSGTIGEFYEIPNGAERGIMNQALLKFTLNSLIHKSYFLYTMEWVKDNFEKKGSGLQNIGSVKTIKETSISVPSLTLQQEFAKKIEAIEKQKELVKQSLAETEILFNSRMDYYFN